jgi:hypothetical protein
MLLLLHCYVHESVAMSAAVVAALLLLLPLAAVRSL